MRGVRGRLLARSGGDGLLYVAELHDRAAVPKTDHLTCFLPGLLALGHLHGVNTGENGESTLTLSLILLRRQRRLAWPTPSQLSISVLKPAGLLVTDATYQHVGVVTCNSRPLMLNCSGTVWLPGLQMLSAPKIQAAGGHVPACSGAADLARTHI